MMLVVLLFAALQCMGQLSSSSLSGLVRDPSGLPGAGAEITLRHEPTGFSTVVRSGEDGGYSAEALLPGRYSVFVTKLGFRTLTVSGLDLGVNQQGRFDIELSPGESVDT